MTVQDETLTIREALRQDADRTIASLAALAERVKELEQELEAARVFRAKLERAYAVWDRNRDNCARLREAAQGMLNALNSTAADRGEIRKRAKAHLAAVLAGETEEVKP